jgi:uncharacterized membrane protein YjjB (DUF3815 family)
MQTVYDWVTMIVFAGLIVLFLQRSQGEPRDHLWQYLVAAVGCAATNYLGNEGFKLESMAYHFGAIALGLATVGFIFVVLRPLDGFNE